MRKLYALALAGALAVATTGGALAAPDDVPEAVLGVEATNAYDALPVEVQIDLARALLASGALNDGMARLPNGEGEIVLGEEAHVGDVTRETLLEMLLALRARAGMLQDLSTVPSS